MPLPPVSYAYGVNCGFHRSCESQYTCIKGSEFDDRGVATLRDPSLWPYSIVSP